MFLSLISKDLIRQTCMAHSYNWESEGLYRKFTGEISGEEILISNFEIQSREEFVTIKYIINDFSDISGYTVNHTHTGIYARTDDIISDTKGKLKIAIIADKEEVIALAKNYRQKMKNSQFSCEIFKTLEEAKMWAA